MHGETIRRMSSKEEGLRYVPAAFATAPVKLNTVIATALSLPSSKIIMMSRNAAGSCNRPLALSTPTRNGEQTHRG